jgi:hypothetical protein
MFNNLLQGDEEKAWEAFCVLSTNFLGNIRAENHKELIEGMSLYHKLVCNMSLNIHMPHSHLDFFLDNCGMVSDDHGERFHQEIETMEKGVRESGPLHVEYYCLTLARNAHEQLHKRRAKRSLK